MAVHVHAYHVAGVQLRRVGTPDVCLEGNIVGKVHGKLQTVAEDLDTTTQDAQLHDLVSEAVAPSDAQVIEVRLGDLHFSCEAIVGHVWRIIQSGLSTRIHTDYWLEPDFQPG